MSLECFCFSLHVDQSLTKTNKKSQWMCVLNVFHDCIWLISNTHTWVLLWCVCFRYAMTLSSCTCVIFWMFCGQQRPVLGESFKSTKFRCYLPSSEEQTVTKLTRFQVTRGRLQFGQTTLWSDEMIVQLQSVTSQCFSQPFSTSSAQAYINHLCVLISPKSISKYVHSYKCMKPLLLVIFLFFCIEAHLLCCHYECEK